MKIILIVALGAGMILLLIGIGLLSRVLHPEAYTLKITQRGELE